MLWTWVIAMHTYIAVPVIMPHAYRGLFANFAFVDNEYFFGNIAMNRIGTLRGVGSSEANIGLLWTVDS